LLVPSVEGGLERGGVYPLSRGPAEGSAKGVSSEAELAFFPRVGSLPSSKAEMWCPTGGLGGEASSETEIVLLVRGGLGQAVTQSWVVGRVCIGPLWDLERIWVLQESWRSSMVSGCRVTTELSSLVASSSPGSPSSSPSSPSDRRKTVGPGSV